MECPRCDGQGEVHFVVIKKTNEKVYLCDECDALWGETEEINKANFTDFGTYVEQFGLQGTWNEIEPVEPSTNK